MLVEIAFSVMLLWAHIKTYEADRCFLSELCALHTCSSSSSLGGSSLLICLSPLRFLGAGSRWSVGSLGHLGGEGSAEPIASIFA